jgi:hypothetical protein
MNALVQERNAVLHGEHGRRDVHANRMPAASLYILKLCLGEMHARICFWIFVIEAIRC